MNAELLADSLRQLPEEIAAEVADLDDAQLRWRPAPEEWSILEVCAHLRDAVEIEGMRLRAMLAEDGVLLPAFDGHAYLRERLYRFEDFARVMVGLRTNCFFAANIIHHLKESDWERKGVHEEAGPVTVASRAQGLIDHAQDHLDQVQNTKDAFGSS